MLPSIMAYSQPVSISIDAISQQEGVTNHSPAIDPPPQCSHNDAATRRRRQGGGCWKVIMFMFIVLVIVAVLLLIFGGISVPFVHGPRIEINDFSVSNFNALFSGFTGNWEGKLTVDNKNSRVKLVFDRISSDVYYDEGGLYTFFTSTYHLASAFTKPFSLETEKSNTTYVKLSASNVNIRQDAVDRIAKNRESGKVSFRLDVYFSTRFEPKPWIGKKRSYSFRCEMEVVFDGATGNGHARPKDLRRCRSQNNWLF